MKPNDIVWYYGEGAPVPAQFVRYISDKKAVIRLAGELRGVHVSSLKEIAS